MKPSSSKDRPVLEAVLESSEVVADTLMKGDLIAEIPIFGTAFKICKAADSIRERAFVAKLAAFISGLDSVDDSKKEKMRDRVKSSPDEAKRIGETLFFVLERVTDCDKPAILSKLFLAYVDNVISGQDLRRMAQAIDTAFSDDLQKFIEVKTLPKKSESGWMQHLVYSGLTCAVTGKTIDEAGLLYYEATTLGNKFRTAYLRRGSHG
jgi:hypothetical protein